MSNPIIGRRSLLKLAAATPLFGINGQFPGPLLRFKEAAAGNPAPAPANVPVLWLGAAERVSVIVGMTHPGVWTRKRYTGCSKGAATG